MAASSRWSRFWRSATGRGRARGRAAAPRQLRHYDAVGTGRRTSGWQRRATDANAAARAAAVPLRELSRDLTRNNGWAARALEVIETNAVGAGIAGKPASATRANPATRQSRERRVAEIWSEWSSTPACDFDGRLNFAGIQALVLRTVVESGEALVLRESTTSGDDLPVPVKIRVLEPDYLDEHRRSTDVEGNEVVRGVEFNPSGRRVAYWLFPEHPGSEGVGVGAGAGSVRVPADRVAHVYRVERPGQVRGVPWLAAAIARLQDFDVYDDTRLIQQQVAACFGAFVQDLEGGGAALGEENATDDEIDELQPGMIVNLGAGKSVSFATPPAGADHPGFTATSLRRIAVSIGVTYEDLTGDYSKVNFSSARMSRMAHWGNVRKWQWQMLIPQLCTPVWDWVIGRAAELDGIVALPPRWSPPPMPMLEPDKEGLALTRLVRSGTMTLAQAIRERGGDPDEVLAEHADTNAKLDRLGLTFDSDPRRVSAAGMSQPEPSSGDGGANDDDGDGE